MATVILEPTQTETPEAKILGKDWTGEFQLYCKTYNDEPVTLEIRDPDGTWQTAKFETKDIQLNAAGQVLDIRLVKDYDYRLTTKTEGAEVLIAKYN